MNSLNILKNKGQSIWLDSISKQMIDSGDLKKIIDEGITGITSNPSIFEKAITSTNFYDLEIEKALKENNDSKSIFEKIAANDIKKGADLLLETYEKTKQDDGYISLEVDPSLANNKDKTILLLHGLRSQKDDEYILNFIREFHKLGFSIIAIDFRNHGDSSKGDFTFGVDEINDVYNTIESVSYTHLTLPTKRIV